MGAGCEYISIPRKNLTKGHPWRAGSGYSEAKTAHPVGVSQPLSGVPPVLAQHALV